MHICRTKRKQGREKRKQDGKNRKQNVKKRKEADTRAMYACRQKRKASPEEEGRQQIPEPYTSAGHTS